MDTVLYLSGTTRGGTLEGICRSFAGVLREMDLQFVELSLLDLDQALRVLRTIDPARVRFALSCVGMGADVALQREGKEVNLWQELGIPYITLHGDSPAYFFDRHVVRNSSFISLYAFAEHCELRRRLPRVNGPIANLPPILLDEIPRDAVDGAAKKQGKLVFLKNGKDPFAIRRQWKTWLDRRTLQMLYELADELEANLDGPGGNQIDDVVTGYFAARGLDAGTLVKLRLMLIAQLDDYLRAVKCTRMAVSLMDLPVEIRGNNWEHVDFRGKRATYIDDCNYVDSIRLIRSSLGTIDMSANTASAPHDRVMRAYGAKTVCLTNAGQTFLRGLPHQHALTFHFDDESLPEQVAGLLAKPGDAVEMGIAVAERFKELNPPERSFETMLDYAAMAKMDQTPHRPAGVQDFFVWPPQLLA